MTYCEKKTNILSTILLSKKMPKNEFICKFGVYTTLGLTVIKIHKLMQLIMTMLIWFLSSCFFSSKKFHSVEFSLFEKNSRTLEQFLFKVGQNTILEKHKNFFFCLKKNSGPHCVKFRELSNLTRDLSQAEKKISVVTKMTTSTIFCEIDVILCSAFNNIYFLLSFR